MKLARQAIRTSGDISLASTAPDLEKGKCDHHQANADPIQYANGANPFRDTNPTKVFTDYERRDESRDEPDGQYWEI